MVSFRRAVFAAMFSAVSCLSFMGSVGVADEATDAPQEVASPLLLINLASVDRAVERMEFLFKSVDQPQLIDTVMGQLTRVRDLKGLDRKRPAGMMIFLEQGLIPTPLPVAYLPVDDINELIQTAAIANFKITKSAEKDDWYTLVPDNGETQHIKLQHGYAFISNTETTLDRDFVDPNDFAKGLNSRYDVCASANLKVTPKPIKELLLNVIRLTTQTEMQRRDTEPEPAYRIRRANAESNLRFVENILKYGEELTIGGKVDEEKKQAYLELLVKATPDTDFAEELGMTSKKPSRFLAAVDESVPLTFSISIDINKHDKKTLKELFDVGASATNRAFAGLPVETPDEEIPQLQSVKDLFNSLGSTIDEGHLDGFFQFMGETGDNFVLIGGVRLVNGQRFGAGLAEILGRIRESNNGADIALSVDAHQDVVFHRITPERRGRGEQRLYGEEYSFFLGTDNESLWFAIGGKDAIPTLKAAIDRVEEGKRNPVRRKEQIPFQLIFNTSKWIEQQAAGRPDGRPGRFGRMLLQSFEDPGSDIIRVDAKPVEDGFRLRVQFENGWIKAVGNGVARAMGVNPEN